MPGECFGNCQCMCDHSCTSKCSLHINEKQKNACLTTHCGCPKVDPQEIVTVGDQLWAEDLISANEDDIQDVFDQEIATSISPARQKRLSKLSRKLIKVKAKWDQYIANADALEIDATIFCDEKCASDCFSTDEYKDQEIFQIVSKCLIKDCQCFTPELPKASQKQLNASALKKREAETKALHAKQLGHLQKLRAMFAEVDAEDVQVADGITQEAKTVIKDKFLDNAPKTEEPKKEEVCDIMCFKECMTLKKKAPFNVIKACVSTRCHCNVDAPVEAGNKEFETHRQMLLDLQHVNGAGEQVDDSSFLGTFMKLMLVLLVCFGISLILQKYGVQQKIFDMLERKNGKDHQTYDQPLYERIY